MPEALTPRKTTRARSRTTREAAASAENVARKHRSFHEAPTIQDKIRQWQTLNSADAADSDEQSVRSQSRSEVCRTPARSPTRSPSQTQIPEAASTPRRRSTKWVQQENKQWVKQRRSTRGERQGRSPKARLQETSLDTDLVREETPPVGDYVRTESTRTRNVSRSRTEREERRKRRKEARARASNGGALVDVGIRVYPRSESLPPTEHAETEVVPASSPGNRARRKGQERTPDRDSRQSSNNLESPPYQQSTYEKEEDEAPRQPSKYAQTLGKPPPEFIEQPKTRKRTIINKTKEMLTGRNDATETPSNRLPSITAWLEEQPEVPDPFVDDRESVMPAPRRVPAPKSAHSPRNDEAEPVKHRSRRKKASAEPAVVEVSDPNKIWDSLNPVQQREARRNSRKEQRNAAHQETETSPPKRRLFSFEVCEEPSGKGVGSTDPPPDNAEHESQSSINLRRRGARTIRKKQRSSSEDPIVAAQDPTTEQQSRSPKQSPQTRKAAQREHKDLPDIPEHAAAGTMPGANGDVVVGLDRGPSRSFKRKLTTHEDLISVLSQSRTRRSTRSIRSAKAAERPSPESVIQATFKTMIEDEQKYLRELRTLVDGVTPVLLQSLLSKTDAAATAGLFSDHADNDASFTRPIIDMGVALQRLKNLHSRIPLQDQNIDSLLTWAVSAHKSYADYVKSWRLGFQGVIVNLAPLDESQMTQEDMLARDVDGDVTDDHGQKVDVAQLQKRPLIRIKRLSKLFTTVKVALPDSSKAAQVADMFEGLTEKAQQKHSEERGRLEDQAAANIDATRARNIKTLAPMTDFEVDKCRKVRARDDFSLSLLHSTGQRLDCKVEIVYRDDPQPSGAGGDILICQVEEESKWLLFAPIPLSNVSARRDQDEHDMVMMIKGVAGIGKSWSELLALNCEDKETIADWTTMLKSNPLPPRLSHIPTWHAQSEPLEEVLPLPEPLIAVNEVSETPKMQLNASALANLPSDCDVPIGEPSVILTRKKGRPKEVQSSTQTERQPQKLSLGGGLRKTDLPEHYQHAANIPSQRQYPPANRTSEQPITSGPTSSLPHRSHKPSRISMSAGAVTNNPVINTPQIQQPAYSPQKIYHSTELSGTTTSSKTSYTTGSYLNSNHSMEVQQEPDELLQEIEKAQSDWPREAPLMSGGLGPATLDEAPKPESAPENENTSTEPKNGAKYFPPRQRKYPRTKSFSSTPLSESIREGWAAMDMFKKKTRSTPNTPERATRSPVLVIDDLPTPRPSSNREDSYKPEGVAEEQPPPPAAHEPSYNRSPESGRLSSSYHPQSVHAQPPLFDIRSPLRQEYQPSSSTSGTESETESDDTSDTSDDADADGLLESRTVLSEMKDQPTPLIAVGMGTRRSSYGPARPLPSIPSTGTRTLDPSDSASQGPYRRAPPPSAFPANKKKRAIAMVCSWSDRGVWEPVSNDECSIVIFPGLVQAFPMSAAHSQPMKDAEWEENEQSLDFQGPPLVEFELTPVVPLRKGTALDITIRSPPTTNSTVRATNNVMFRSATVQECEKLYQLINWARCNNPTYAQLVRSRAREEPMTFATDVPQTKSKSWFSFGSREKTSYRASSRPPTSIADSAASGSSATSAFSALRRFGKDSPFSLKRSSVVRKPGMANFGGGSLYSSSDGTGLGSGTSTPAPSQTGFVPGPDGPNVPQTSAEAASGGGMVNNMKIRLFLRVNGKWDPLGQCLLSVLPATLDEPQRPGSSSGTSTPPAPITPVKSSSNMGPSAIRQPRDQHFRLPSSSHTPHRIHGDGREKRIVVKSAKSHSLVLLDETLSESCFEKVMQTGIAVNVWREDEEVQEFGGVMTGRSRMYMIQFRTSSEASWVFHMCGKNRYG